MLVIPAIDLKAGQCVRLLQGKKDEVTAYSDDPVATARLWESCGAGLLHIVDLDGAFTGTQPNIDAIGRIREAVGMEIEVGGGIRDIEKIDRLINMGINRVILGTVVVKNPDMVKRACSKYPDKILAGIDAKGGKVAVKGWEEVTSVDAVGLAKSVEAMGVAGIIYTDISRDGMLTGPNIRATQEIVKAVNIPVIASGGISSIDDIKNLMKIENLWGAITGKAIYSGTLDLKEAIRLCLPKE